MASQNFKLCHMQPGVLLLTLSGLRFFFTGWSSSKASSSSSAARLVLDIKHAILGNMHTEIDAPPHLSCWHAVRQASGGALKKVATLNCRGPQHGIWATALQVLIVDSVHHADVRPQCCPP